MATLLELHTIEANSVAEIIEPADPAVVAAHELRAKVRTAVLKRAGVILATPLPTTDPERSDALELLAWAQKAVANPDAAAGPVFRLTLANNAGATVAGILGASDQVVEDAIGPVLALLSKGLHPGSR